MKKDEVKRLLTKEIKKLALEFSDIESMSHYSIPVTKKISEGSMSDISITAMDSKSLLDFVKKIKSEYPEMFPKDPKLTGETLKWLKIIYNQAQEDKKENQ